MRPDPRCPSCDGKVSATARWCMHCGRDFDAPVDANATDRGGGRAGGRSSAPAHGAGGEAGGPFAPDPGESRDGGTVTVPAEESGASVDGSTGTVTTATGTVEDSTATVDSATGTVETDVETDIGESAVETSRARSSGTSLSGAGLLHAAVGSVVDFVGVSEDRREAVALGVPGLVWLWTAAVWEGSFVSGPGIGIIVAGLLGGLLYTRKTAKATLAAALYGTGFVLTMVPILETAEAAASGAALVSALPGASWFVFTGALIVAGTWLQRQAF